MHDTKNLFLVLVGRRSPPTVQRRRLRSLSGPRSLNFGATRRIRRVPVKVSGN